MTILIKPLSSEKKPVDQAQPLVQPNSVNIDPEVGNGRIAVIVAEHGSHPYSTRARGIRAFVLTVLVMLIGYFGGLAIYRILMRSSMHRGYCRVPFQNARSLMHQELMSPVFTIPVNSAESQEFDEESMYFRENYQFDVDDGSYFELEVPEFGNGRQGRFIHEFDSNQSAIVDINAKRCFIMPLDRERIMAPKNLFEVMVKMQQGLYNLNTTIIRETMRVNPDPLQEEDMFEVGSYIRQQCAGKQMYRLEKQTDRIVKRDVGGLMAGEKPFIEFGGKNIVQYEIFNLRELDAEKTV